MKNYKHPLRFLSIITVLSLTGLAFLTSANAAVLYSQTFNNVTGNNTVVGTVGWAGYLGANATAAPNNGSVDTVMIANVAGNPSTDGNSFLFAQNPNTASQIFAATTTFASINPTTITWKQGNSDTAIQVRLMVQSGGNWYASSTAFTNASTYTAATFSSAGNAADVSKSFTFTTSASAWRSLTLTPGTSLILGSVIGSNLSSSSITGVGFFVSEPSLNQKARLDTLEIVPEPTTIVMFGLGLAGILCLRKRAHTTV